MAQCCICENEAESVALKEFAPWSARQCCGCGLVFLDDRVDQGTFVDNAAEQLSGDAADKTVEYWSFPRMYDRHRRVFDEYFAERLERLQAYCAQLRRVLDVGCGFGFFMRYLAERGIETYGLDIEAQSVSYARQELGLDVEHISFENYRTDLTFDAIVACDVLEHVDDPAGFLAKCHQLLRPGGALYIQVPNVLGDVLPADGSFNWPYHIWQFDADTLGRLLDGNRFEPCEWWTGVMGVIGVYESGGPDEDTAVMWQRAQAEKRGNRLQMLACPR